MKREKLLALLSDKEEKELLAFKKRGYLYDIGWINSLSTGTIVDQSGKPLPWVTYPYIKFIEERLKCGFEIFEFGSGNSTLYYADKVAGVYSVENNEFWYDKIKSTMPSNVKLSYCELVYGGSYCKYATQTDNQYDMIIVDGRDRVNCCINNLSALKSTGVMVLDDSEREQYAPGINFLTKRIDFWGTAPTVNYLKCTTVFYRDNNCLGI
ncbi:hypothetical protein [Mucilaginibacter mallensis]|nr:hypothetical protein [Mucilaginibacter mallensis]